MRIEFWHILGSEDDWVGWIWFPHFIAFRSLGGGWEAALIMDDLHSPLAWCRSQQCDDSCLLSGS
jgi:hypothetical protein